MSNLLLQCNKSNFPSTWQQERNEMLEAKLTFDGINEREFGSSRVNK